MGNHMRTYNGYDIHTELIRECCWIAYIRESVVTGMGATPNNAIENLTRLMDTLGPSAIDMVREERL